LLSHGDRRVQTGFGFRNLGPRNDPILAGLAYGDSSLGGAAIRDAGDEGAAETRRESNVRAFIALGTLETPETKYRAAQYWTPLPDGFVESVTFLTSCRVRLRRPRRQFTSRLPDL